MHQFLVSPDIMHYEEDNCTGDEPDHTLSAADFKETMVNLQSIMKEAETADLNNKQGVLVKSPTAKRGDKKSSFVISCST